MNIGGRRVRAHTVVFFQPAFPVRGQAGSIAKVVNHHALVHNCSKKVRFELTEGFVKPVLILSGRPQTAGLLASARGKATLPRVEQGGMVDFCPVGRPANKWSASPTCFEKLGSGDLKQLMETAVFRAPGHGHVDFLAHRLCREGAAGRYLTVDARLQAEIDLGSVCGRDRECQLAEYELQVRDRHGVTSKLQK